jgi:hypothetical protein
MNTHVLMTCVCKYDNGKRCERRDWASPFKDAYSPSIDQGVSFDVMRYDENNEICDRK